MARDRAARPEARSLRLFVAGDIPEGVREELARAREPWRERYRGRWVPPENWHVTLKFLGAVWPRLLEWVTEAVGGVAEAHAPFESALEGVGIFPGGRRARVLWAALADPEGRFAALARSLDETLAREFKPETRPFTAHLTLARFDPPAEIGDDVRKADVRSDSFVVDRLVLYRSHLQRPAPRYEPLREFPLGG
jgi:2'-5' RNA ligase